MTKQQIKDLILETVNKLHHTGSASEVYSIECEFLQQINGDSDVFHIVYSDSVLYKAYSATLDYCQFCYQTHKDLEGVEL